MANRSEAFGMWRFGRQRLPQLPSPTCRSEETWGWRASKKKSGGVHSLLWPFFSNRKKGKAEPAAARGWSSWWGTLAQGHSKPVDRLKSNLSPKVPREVKTQNEEVRRLQKKTRGALGWMVLEQGVGSFCIVWFIGAHGAAVQNVNLLVER